MTSDQALALELARMLYGMRYMTAASVLLASAGMRLAYEAGINDAAWLVRES